MPHAQQIQLGLELDVSTLFEILKLSIGAKVLRSSPRRLNLDGIVLLLGRRKVGGRCHSAGEVLGRMRGDKGTQVRACYSSQIGSISSIRWIPRLFGPSQLAPGREISDPQGISAARDQLLMHAEGAVLQLPRAQYTAAIHFWTSARQQAFSGAGVGGIA